MLASAAFSVWHGQDINYDQLNYHFYAAYADWTNRLGRDVAPAQILHSYLSPYVYLPFFFMVNAVQPIWIGSALGALHGSVLWLAGLIGWMATAGMPRRPRIAACLAGVVLSLASPFALSEVGTTLTDIVTAIPVLAGLALLMRQTPGNDIGMPAILGLGIGGALLGSSVSLKLTNASFAVAFAAASLFGHSDWRQRSVSVLSVALGGICGFALIGGGWYVRMWQSFRNPIFPYFNSIFRSPEYGTSKSVFDDRFMPHSIARALNYPFVWVNENRTTAELAFRDIRFASLACLAVVAIIVYLAARRSPSAREAVIQPAGIRLAVFIALSFCIWMYVWSIQRYIVVIELLLGPAIIVALRACVVAFPSRHWLCAATCGALALTSACTVKVVDWGHIGWSPSWYAINIPPAASPNPIYLLDGDPLSYVVPLLQPGASAIAVTEGEDMASIGNGFFQRRIKALLAGPNHVDVRAIANGPLSDIFRRRVAQYELVQGKCQTVPGRPAALTWCTMQRASATK